MNPELSPFEIEIKCREIELARHDIKGNSCKNCITNKIPVPVGRFNYIEHCRVCDNWQASF